MTGKKCATHIVGYLGTFSEGYDKVGLWRGLWGDIRVDLRVGLTPTFTHLIPGCKLCGKPTFTYMWAKSLHKNLVKIF
jgi:hypothetical protein